MGLTRSLTHLAVEYGDKNHLDSALYFHEEALRLARIQHNHYGRAHYLSNAGEILLLLNQNEDALVHFTEALFILKEMNQNLVLCRSYYSLSNYYVKNGETAKARSYF